MTQRRAPRASRRRRRIRRRSDVYYELGKLAGLVAFVCVSIIGQAELIGEPWRHVLAVTGTISAAIWAYGMHPKAVINSLRAYRAKL